MEKPTEKWSHYENLIVLTLHCEVVTFVLIELGYLRSYTIFDYANKRVGFAPSGQNLKILILNKVRLY
jgi:hypothetical protein